MERKLLDRLDMVQTQGKQNKRAQSYPGMRYSVMTSTGYDKAFLQNENAIFSFQITLFLMLNNCIFGVLQCHNC